MLNQMLVKAVRSYPDKVAVVYDDLRISYHDLFDKVEGLSRGLSSLSISEADCIAILLPNCPEFVISFYAVTNLNAIVLPLNHLFKADEIGYYLSDSEAKAIITDAKRADSCRDTISKLGKDIELIVIDHPQPPAQYFYDLILSDASAEPCRFEGNAIYQYSSGSTGRPKRVCRTQKNLYHEVRNFAETANVETEDNILCTVPLYHAHGLGNCLLAATCNGATLVILEQSTHNGVSVEVPFVFRCPRVIELIEREKITIFPAVPYIFNALAETPANAHADLSTLRICFSAGNFLGRDIFDKFLQRFEVPVRQLYGCTEVGAISINLDTNPEETQHSVGAPLNNVEIRIVDEANNDMSIGEIGEVVVKSQALTNGYHNMPELNQQAFREGAFFTGDLGKLDEAGRLYITGRKKILIDTGGRKVDPIEVEDILLTHPKVKEAVVVGVKGAHAGEIVKAVLVLKESEQCEEQAIFSFCKERLAEFKVPKIVGKALVEM
jgi:long-chain acyl-CoA synthetase